jgi:hypothetical protein
MQTSGTGHQNFQCHFHVNHAPWDLFVANEPYIVRSVNRMVTKQDALVHDLLQRLRIGTLLQQDSPHVRIGWQHGTLHSVAQPPIASWRRRGLTLEQESRKPRLAACPWSLQASPLRAVRRLADHWWWSWRGSGRPPLRSAWPRSQGSRFSRPFRNPQPRSSQSYMHTLIKQHMLPVRTTARSLSRAANRKSLSRPFGGLVVPQNRVQHHDRSSRVGWH